MTRSQVIFAYKFYPRETFEARLQQYMKRFTTAYARRKGWEDLLQEIMDFERTIINIRRRKLFWLHGLNQQYKQIKKTKS